MPPGAPASTQPRPISDRVGTVAAPTRDGARD
jgi:hypothetical protein